MSDNDSKIIAGCIVGILSLAAWVALVVYFTWAGAVVLTHLWAWFIVPIFHLPTLSLIGAAGISLVIGYLTKSVSVAKTEDDQSKLWSSIIVALLSPWLTLLVGYIIHNLQ